MAKKTKVLKNDVPLVGIVGMGYVGLPLAREFCKGGAKVLGFDINAGMVAKLNKGISPIRHIPNKQIRQMLATRRFRVTDSMRQLSRPDAILICVPTPLTENREPDMKYVVATCEMIARYLRKGQLVVLESTTYPGTTRELMLPILESSGLKAGKDFYCEKPLANSVGEGRARRVAGLEKTPCLFTNDGRLKDSALLVTMDVQSGIGVSRRSQRRRSRRN